MPSFFGQPAGGGLFGDMTRGQLGLFALANALGGALSSAGGGQPNQINPLQIAQLQQGQQANQQRSQLFDLQAAKLQREAAQENTQMGARATLQGGFDPNTNITWNQPRSGLMPGSPEVGSLMAQAYPEVYQQQLAQQFAPKTETVEDPELYGFPKGTVLQRAPDGSLKVVSKPDTLSPEAEAQKLRIAQAGRASQNVTVGGGKYGTIPPGYELQEGPGGARLVPIPGGPAATEQASAAEAASAKAATQKRYSDVVMDNIGRVRDLVTKSQVPVTGFGSYMAAVPGTPARDTQALVDTIRANIGFDRLQQMREASPTGGALGQVSENENRLLQSTLGNLELSQSEAQFLANLKAVEETYLDIIHGPGNRPGQDGEAGASTVTGGTSTQGQYSQEDLEYTAKQHGITVEEVKKRLGAQ